MRDGRAETALALLDAGADLNQVSAGDHTSPLLMATINGHYDLATALLPAAPTSRWPATAAATPLYGVLNMQWAPKARHPQPAHYMQQQIDYLELAEAFLKAGADVNARLDQDALVHHLQPRPAGRRSHRRDARSGSPPTRSTSRRCSCC